jgi:hypothetical protein
MGMCGSPRVQQQCSHGWLVLLGTKTSEDKPFWLLSSYVNVLLNFTEGACAGDRREDRSAEGARSRSVRAMGAQRAPQVVRGGPVSVILRCAISGC